MPHGSKRRSLCVSAGVVLGLVAAVAALLAAEGGAATARTSAFSVVNVTVGKPRDVSVTFSKRSNLTPGSVIFKVTNDGSVAHTFQVCSQANTNGKLADSCAGSTVALPTTGSTATLSVTLKKGQYEFLMTAAGQAVLGRKGLIGVGAKVPTAGAWIPLSAAAAQGGGGSSSSSSGGSGSGSSGVTFPVGNAANGAALWTSSSCGSCHVLAAANSSGTAGPNLDTLKASVSDTEGQVYYGGGDMPAFNASLSKQQIADLSTWVAQVA